VAPEEDELAKLLPGFNKADSRISELVLGRSRGDSAFMRVNSSAFDEFGLSKGLSGLGYGSRPPTIYNDNIVRTNIQVKDEMNKKLETEDTKVGQQSAIESFVKQNVTADYFNKQPKRERKKRKLEDDD